MSQTQVVVHLRKRYFKLQGQITLWLQGRIGIVQQMKIGTSEIILFIQGDLQGQKINSKVK